MTFQVSAAARSVWAKSDRDDPGSSMSLVQHMVDSAGVAGLLWDEWLPTSVRREIGRGLPAGESAGRLLLVWLAAAHDLGKASPAFATQIPLLANRMRDEGLVMAGRPLGFREAPHSLVSHHLLERWLIEEHGWDREIARTYAVVPGGHHGVTPTKAQLNHLRERADDNVGTGKWRDVQDELAEFAVDLAGAGDRLPAWGAAPLRPQAQVLVTATVILADWLASNKDLFPYEVNNPDRLRHAWELLQLPGPWRAVAPPDDIDDLYRARFGFPSDAVVRPVQQVAVEVARSQSEPGLMIIEAAMGVGKTEAALAVAETYAARVGAGGCFVALPTMATSDAMFGRVGQWVASLPSVAGEVRTMFLAHGKAGLNDDFQGLAREWNLVGVYDEPDADQRAERTSETVTIAHSWLFGRKKGVLADFVVGTIDQLLFAALKSRHLVLRHLALANKVVVIDECHAYDEYMGVFLKRALAWLGLYGVPTIILSATLPSQTRRTLVEAYDRGRLAQTAAAPADTSWLTAPAPQRREVEDSVSDPYDVFDGEIGYPMISGTSGGKLFVQAVPTDQRTQRVEVDRASDDVETLIALLETALADGGCAAVLRNTVQRAQDTYSALEARFPNQVRLDHARFLSVDRVAIESDLRADLGPPHADTIRPDRVIVVGTQVLEQSLDLDFDLMVSDIAPADLLLQRIGRLHRHSRPSRPQPVAMPRLILVGIKDWGAPIPEPVDSAAAVYSPYVLLRTLAALRTQLADSWVIVLPDDIAPLVERTYSDGAGLPDGWADRARDLRHVYDDEISEARQKAKTFALAEPTPRTSDIVGWEAAGVGDAEDARGQGRVRDSDESIEVIVVQRLDGELHLLPWIENGAALPEDTQPPARLAKIAAGCTVRLPWQLTRHPAVFDQTLAALEQNFCAGWLQSRWLRGQLPLVLDDQLKVSVGAHTVRYDRQIGLTVEKESR